MKMAGEEEEGEGGQTAVDILVEQSRLSATLSLSPVNNKNVL